MFPRASSVVGLVEFKQVEEEELTKTAAAAESQPAAQGGESAHGARQPTKKRKGGISIVIWELLVTPPSSAVVREELILGTQKLKETAPPETREPSPKRPHRDEGGSSERRRAVKTHLLQLAVL